MLRVMVMTRRTTEVLCVVGAVLVAVLVLTAWVDEPPRANRLAPGVAVSYDYGMEQAGCVYVAANGPEDIDLEMVQEFARQARVRYALTVPAVAYARTGDVEDRIDLLVACRTAGYL